MSPSVSVVFWGCPGGVFVVSVVFRWWLGGGVSVVPVVVSWGSVDVLQASLASCCGVLIMVADWF